MEGSGGLVWEVRRPGGIDLDPEGGVSRGIEEGSGERVEGGCRGVCKVR